MISISLLDWKFIAMQGTYCKKNNKIDFLTNSLLKSYSGMHYDYTVVDITPDTDTVSVPNPSVTSPGATMVTFDTHYKCSEPIFVNHINDFYIFEFPRPVFGTQPPTATCDDTTNFYCYLSQGHNWIIVDPVVANTGTSETDFKIVGVD